LEQFPIDIVDAAVAALMTAEFFSRLPSQIGQRFPYSPLLFFAFVQRIAV
jgi:hypothetical protein